MGGNSSIYDRALIPKELFRDVLKINDPVSGQQTIIAKNNTPFVQFLRQLQIVNNITKDPLISEILIQGGDSQFEYEIDENDEILQPLQTPSVGDSSASYSPTSDQVKNRKISPLHQSETIVVEETPLLSDQENPVDNGYSKISNPFLLDLFNLHLAYKGMEGTLMSFVQSWHKETEHGSPGSIKNDTYDWCVNNFMDALEYHSQQQLFMDNVVILCKMITHNQENPIQKREGQFEQIVQIQTEGPNKLNENSDIIQIAQKLLSIHSILQKMQQKLKSIN